MVKLSLLIISILSIYIPTYAQKTSRKPVQKTKQVVVGNFPVIVPEGKVWKLDTSSEVLIELKDFATTSMCGAAILSRPGGTCCLTSGERPYLKHHQLEITGIRRDPSLSGVYLINMEPEATMTFEAGTQLFVNSCLSGIVLKEYNAR